THRPGPYYGFACNGRATRPRQSSSVVEQRTHKPLVGGSNPSSGTNSATTHFPASTRQGAVSSEAFLRAAEPPGRILVPSRLWDSPVPVRFRKKSRQRPTTPRQARARVRAGRGRESVRLTAAPPCR